MAGRDRGRAGAVALAAIGLLAACSPTASGGAKATHGDGVAATTTPPATTVPPVPVASTAAPPPLPPPTRFTPSSTTSSTTETSVAGEPPPGVDEAAQRGRAAPLERPTGFARFEPAAAWTAYAPLTGLAFDPAIADRAALAVKIDNSPGGQPQFNLADADVVFEENVEGVTRFVAVYHTTMPDRIGPVRSARTTDLDILAGLNRPILAWSGGNAIVTLRVRGAHEFGWLANLSAQHTGCFWRSGLRRSPHNLLLDPICARESATFAGPAQPVFVHGYGDVDTPRTDAPVVSVEMSGLTPTWRWDRASGRYLRSQRGGAHVDVDGERVAAANVVVLHVKYVTSEADELSPEAVTVGYGPATVYRDGVAIEATWSRPDRFSAYALVDLEGDPVPLAPGPTWIELPRQRG